MARKTAALCQSRRTAVKRKCSGASLACVPGFGLLHGICMCNAVCAPLSVYNFVGLCNACLCLHMWVRSHSSASVHLVLSDQSLSAVSSVDAFFCMYTSCNASCTLILGWQVWRISTLSTHCVTK